MHGSDGPSSATPAYDLSVVIPTYNREALLARCLHALRRQTQAPSSFEVIVVDDGSTDGTAELLASVQTPFALRPLFLAHQGKAAARNAGAGAVRGRVCLFLDDDVLASPGLLAAHAEAHAVDNRVIGIGAVVREPAPGSDWYTRALARACNRDHERLQGAGASWSDCHGGNMSVALRPVLELGGFSEQTPVGEDKELAFRLWERGFRPTYVSRARGAHADDQRRAQLLERTERRGAGWVTLSDRVPAMTLGLLGWFRATTNREIGLRQVLLMLHAPPRVLALVGPLVPGEGRRKVWFEFVSRFTFWRAVRRSVTRHRWRLLTQGIPILMYHAFDQRADRQRFIVSKRSFRRQMRLLAILRYRVIPLEELLRELREGGLPPLRALAITIDDGYRDNLVVAAPVLSDFRYPATIFLVSERLGGRNDWSHGDELAGRPILSVRDVQQMRDHGLRVGAHTRTHPMLPETPDAAIGPEIEGSRDDLEQQLGTPVPLFSYPYGGHDDRAVAAARAAYAGACTVEPRPVRLNDDPYLLPRIEVRGTDSLLRFVRKLSFGGS